MRQTKKQRQATFHNWQHYKLNGIVFQLRGIEGCETLTDESKAILRDVIDHVGMLRTSMRQRRE